MFVCVYSLRMAEITSSLKAIYNPVKGGLTSLNNDRGS